MHGNLNEQEAAKTLSMLSLNIAMLISHAAAMPMFDDSFSQRHFDSAEYIGAIIKMNVDFRYYDPTDQLDKDGSLNINTPGTKMTPKMAVYVAEMFLKNFKDSAPVADLKSATCTVQGTGQKVFDIKFHVKTTVGIDDSSRP